MLLEAISLSGIEIGLMDLVTLQDLDGNEHTGFVAGAWFNTPGQPDQLTLTSTEKGKGLERVYSGPIGKLIKIIQRHDPAHPYYGG